MNVLMSKKEEYKIRTKLVSENIRRVLFTALICSVLVPVMLLINKFSASEFAGVTKGMLTVAEIFSAAVLIMSYYSLRTHDIKLSTVVYRSYWFIFEAIGFVINYSDRVSGSGFSFYPVMAAALFLVPAMSFTDQLYHIVILAVYTVFMSIKFEVHPNEIFNMIALCGALIGISRLMFMRQTEIMVMKEREREQKDNESIDPLTGLLNRRGLEKCVEEEMRDCIMSRRRTSILMIDIDCMTQYNDSFGYERGDDCIRQVSEVIRQVILRNTDTICRLDGGRFIVFMEGGSDMEPVSLAEKLRANIERKRIPHGRRASNPFVTVSIGVASCIPKYESSFTEMYDEAEDALFEAKERGRNVTVYDEQVYGAYVGRTAN